MGKTHQQTKVTLMYQYNEPTVQYEEIVEEVNATNMGQNLETDNGAGNPQDTRGATGTHRYNLQSRPIRKQERLNLMQSGKQSTYAE